MLCKHVGQYEYLFFGPMSLLWSVRCVVSFFFKSKVFGEERGVHRGEPAAAVGGQDDDLGHQLHPQRPQQPLQSGSGWLADSLVGWFDWLVDLIGWLVGWVVGTVGVFCCLSVCLSVCLPVCLSACLPEKTPSYSTTSAVRSPGFDFTVPADTVSALGNLFLSLYSTVLSTQSHSVVAATWDANDVCAWQVSDTLLLWFNDITSNCLMPDTYAVKHRPSRASRTNRLSARYSSTYVAIFIYLFILHPIQLQQLPRCCNANPG